ncbi:MAG: aldehyde dehydrogenase family protein [Methanomassiliicoccales archaeon]|nr:aldehyde dehydrogenase family protein [Methanomassiliicoccales archaeon]
MSRRTVIHKYNPANLEFVGEAEVTPSEEVPKIIDTARKAQAEWAALPLDKRKNILHQVQNALAKRTDEFVGLVSQETGKPAMEALATDVMNALSVGDFAVGRMEHIFRESTVDFGSLSTMMRYMGRSSHMIPRPLGVVGIIATWNYPLAIPYSQAMMALAAGNAVILKPSSHTPLTALRMGEMMLKTGIPEGLMQVIVGSGEEVGEALVRSNVDRLVFTGHPDVGHRIMTVAAQRLTPLTLELGGKDAFIVLKDADLRRAAKAACWGSFVNCGQTCVAVKRIYLHRSVEKKFTELFLEEVRALKQGYDPEDPSLTVGPLISEKAIKDMETQVARALEQGAKILIGGQRKPGEKGYFFEPTVITNAAQSSDIVQKETFGPIVVLLTFDSEEEVVRLNNDSLYALNGSVWTSDLEKGREIATRLRSGTITVNNVAYTYGLGATPWGGRGESGFGRTHGDNGFEEMIERQHVHLDRGKFSSEIWWPPYSEEGMEAMRDFTMLAFVGEKDRMLQRLLRARQFMKR